MRKDVWNTFQIGSIGQDLWLLQVRQKRSIWCTREVFVQRDPNYPNRNPKLTACVSACVSNTYGEECYKAADVLMEYLGERTIRGLTRA